MGALIASATVKFAVCWCRKHKSTSWVSHASSSVAHRARSPPAKAANGPPAPSPRRPGDGRGPLPEPDTVSDAGSDRLPAFVQASIRRRVNDLLPTALRASMTAHMHTDPGEVPGPEGPEISTRDVSPGLAYRVPPSPPPCLQPLPYSEAAACVHTASTCAPPPDRPSKDVRRVANQALRASSTERPARIHARGFAQVPAPSCARCTSLFAFVLAGASRNSTCCTASSMPL